MKLRALIAEQVKDRLSATVPEVMETVWDTDAILVMVEGLSFKPASGYEGDWERRATFEGMIRVELRSDMIDDLKAEALIAQMATNPIIVSLPINAEPGTLHSLARLTLSEWRDSVRDQFVVGALRLKIGGTICSYSPDTGRPEAGVAGMSPRPTNGVAA